MSFRCFLKGKIYKATITEATTEYPGSMGIDPKLMKAAGILPNEKVDVYNMVNGERFSTYAIMGKPGQVALYGAAALKGEVGQNVIICTYTWLSEAEMAAHRPKVIEPGEENSI